MHRRQELGPEFVADDIRDVVHQRHVPGRGHTDCLREDRRDAGARHAMQPLVPPVVFRDAQPWYRRRGMADLFGFLFQRHLRDQVGGPLFDADRRVPPGFCWFGSGTTGKGQGGGRHGGGREQESTNHRHFPAVISSCYSRTSLVPLSGSA